MNPIDPLLPYGPRELSTDGAESSRPTEALRKRSLSHAPITLSVTEPDGTALSRLAHDIDVVKTHVGDVAAEHQHLLSRLKAEIEAGTYRVDADALAAKVYQAIY